MTTYKEERTKVLFICFQFPPMAGPGVHRSLNLVKHLRKSGFEPVVFTIDAQSIKRGNYVTDESLMSGLPEDIAIHRVPSYEPLGFINAMMKLRLFRLFWFLFYPWFWERTAAWPRRSFAAAKQLILQHNIQLVYTSSGPFSPLLLGRALQKHMGVRWVADLRDPFTDAYAWSFPSRLHWLISRAVEKRVLELPDVLVVNTLAVKRLYTKRGIRKSRETVVINNGF